MPSKPYRVASLFFVVLFPQFPSPYMNISGIWLSAFLHPDDLCKQKKEKTGIFPQQHSLF
jgi:hypothetical protein